jgi:hypothetical protein
MASRQDGRSSEMAEESFIRFMRERTADQRSRSGQAAGSAGARLDGLLLIPLSKTSRRCKPPGASVWTL